MYLEEILSPFVIFFSSQIYDINFNQCSYKKTGGHPDHYCFLFKKPQREILNEIALHAMVILAIEICRSHAEILNMNDRLRCKLMNINCRN